jgi:negative regulator of sigma E activity
MESDVVSNKRKEKISAFLDDDMHRDELMSFSLSGEVDDAEIARRYQMVGDALRGEMSDSSFVDISHAVREAVAAEQQYSEQQNSESQYSISSTQSSVQTNASNTASASNNTNSQDLNAKQAGGFNLSNWFRPLSGMAVAASVAVVMVVTLSEQGTDGLSPGAITSPVAANSTVQPAATNSVQVASDNDLQPNDSQLQNTSPLNQQVDPRLFNRHLEFATQDALQGRLPLVRAVSYEADK